MSGAVNKANSRQNTKHASWFKRYREEGRREVNKALKLMRHVRRFKRDQTAKEALKNLPEMAVRTAERKLQARRTA